MDQEDAVSNGNRRHPGITARPTKNRGIVYEVRFRQPDGKEISRSFPSLSSAKRWQVEQQRSRNRGLWIDPKLSRTSFGVWSSEWLVANPSKRERTLHRDAQVLAVVNELWSDRPLHSVTTEDCRRLVSGWIAHGYSPTTIRRMAAVVKAVLNSAVDADRIGRTPWRGIRLPQPAPTTKGPLTPSEVLLLAGEVGHQDGLVIMTAALCGLRFGECAGLQICDIDLNQQVLHIRRTVGEVNGRVVVSPPKSRAGERSLLMPGALARPLAAYISGMRCVASPEDWLFPAPQGGPLRYPNFRNRVFSPACRRLGLDKVTFHDLRKFNATLMVTGGVDIKTAQVRLGHSDPRLTLSVYAQATTESQSLAANAIDTGLSRSLGSQT